MSESIGKDSTFHSTLIRKSNTLTSEKSGRTESSTTDNILLKK